MSKVKILGIATHNMRNDRQFQFHTEFKALVEKNGASALKIAPQFETYVPLYDKVDGAFKKINKSAITKLIQDADKARDEIFLGLVEMNSTARRHFNPDVREAARRLKILFDTYGNVARKPLDEQTSAVYNIMQDLEGKYADDAQLVGLTEWAAELKVRNEIFSALMQERFGESAKKCDVVLKEARAELDGAYRTIVERINALVVVEGAQNYEEFIRGVNVVIKKYAAAMAARTGRAAAKKSGTGAQWEAEDEEEDES